MKTRNFLQINSLKILTAVALVAVFFVVFGSSVFANFLRSDTPLSGFSYGYGSDDTDDPTFYGYGYGYGLTEGSGYSGYGFTGSSGMATSISVNPAQTSAVVTYTSDYL